MTSFKDEIENDKMPAKLRVLVGNWQRKTDRAPSNDMLRRAAKDVKDNSISERQAALNYGVPRTTLKRYILASSPEKQKIGTYKGVTRYKFMPKDIYNTDESRFATVQTPGKVVSSLGKKKVGATTSQERGELTTIACTINAAGNALQPFYIFKRVRWNNASLNGTPVGLIGTAIKTAWMDTEVLSNQNLPFLITNSRCSQDKPVLLLLDNHVSHVSLKTIVLAKNSGVVLLTLPSHTSHRLRPLDRTVFGTMKIFFNGALDDCMRSNPDRSIYTYDTEALYACAFVKAMTL
ncbi:uncharacterized protein [Watersipora subatra]|uniref:uncharacterized protein n=1 Tax=Watersipora subatra TaxID=2589382 RepID=UPI00355B5ED9